MSNRFQLPPSTRIMTEGYSLRYDDRGAMGTVRFLVHGSEVDQFRQVVGGLPESFVYPGGVTGSRVVTLKHPCVEGCYAVALDLQPAPNACTSAPPDHLDDPDLPEDWDPLTDEPPVSFAAEWWVGDVQFRTPDYPMVGETPMISRVMACGEEAIERPRTSYHWASDSKPVGYPTHATLKFVELQFTLHGLPSVNEALYVSLAGRVNNAAFLGFAPGLVQYVGPATEGMRTVGGVPSFDLTHTIRVRELDWNKVMRADTGLFDYPLDGANDRIYKLADLNQLLSN